MPTRAALAAGAWVSGAVLAASGVAGALIVLGNHAFPSVHVLSQAQVRGGLSATPAVTVTISPSDQPTLDSPSQSPMSSSPAPTSSSTAAERAAHSFRGGTVFASCTGGEATLTQRIPAQGYGIDRVWPGPSAAAGVRFSSPARDDLVTITCTGGYPAFASQQEQPGGGDRDSPGPGGPGRGGQPGVPGGSDGPGGGHGGQHGGSGSGSGQHGGGGGTGSSGTGGSGAAGGSGAGSSGAAGGSGGQGSS